MEIERAFTRERAAFLLEQLRERTSFNVLHHDVVGLLGNDVVVNFDDTRMV
jgi:hypothetical protein